LLLLTEAREALMNQIPMFERYQRLLLQNAYIANQARINSALTETAEDKYLNLGKAYPGCKTGTPTHILTSQISEELYINTLLVSLFILYCKIKAMTNRKTVDTSVSNSNAIFSNTSCPSACCSAF
jgi:hypothetical protein